MKVAVYGAALASVLLGTAGQVLFRAGMRTAKPTLGSQLVAMFSPLVMAGLLCYAVSTVFWLQCLSRLPLGLAYPLLGLNFLLVPASAAVILGEPLTLTRLAGGLLILAGICLAYR